METLNLTKIMNKRFEINNPELKEQFKYYNCFADAFEFKCIDTDYPELICRIRVNLLHGNYIHLNYDFRNAKQKEEWCNGDLVLPDSLIYDIDKNTAYAIYKGIRRISNSFVK